MNDGHRQVREYLLRELRRDLVGPTSINEELTERPTSRYLTGILYPHNTRIDSNEDQDAADPADVETGVDQGVLMTTTTNPSAIGLTFTVPTGTIFRVTVKAAIYLEQPQTESNTSLWARKALELDPVSFRAEGTRTQRASLATGLELALRFRERPDHHVVTVSLLNTLHASDDDEPSGFSFFQPEIEVSSIDDEVIFLAQNFTEESISDPDRRQSALVYRHSPEFAVGHGCAVDWEGADKGRAKLLRTAIVPDYEVLQFSPDPPDPYRAQEMLFLSEASVDDTVFELRRLVTAYRDWITELPTSKAPASLQDIVEQNIASCQEVADRIEEGIRVLEDDAEAHHAFKLANRAMLQQRARSDWKGLSEQERPPEPVLDGSHRWRPFQLAFILMCLPGIVDPDHASREVVDLLWFPTGGGKTEAYLGLAAFTIFLRRSRSVEPAGDGVTVLMRYTLRLLTIQQFQRAALLIMACERIRKMNPELLGETPISLGLWVGGGATPNRLREAKQALDSMIDSGEKITEGNPHQIQSCPWCGHEIAPQNYRVESTMLIRCPNEACDYQSDLPIYLIDEDIYLRRPTLLIGTVDKFARLPWLSESSNLFGGTPKTTLPPELIIQDEMHLISGPLGSMVGLYETAIDSLCTHDGIRPKVIASTATVRRAQEQGRALFNRRLVQFPPSGIDSRDSFFSTQVPPETRPGRLYVGVHAPGRSMKTALLRIYALLMQRIYEHGGDDVLRDPYWTLVGYFNSTRELGGALRLVADDIPNRISFLAAEEGEAERKLEYVRELYSQVPSSEITEILEDMEIPLGSPGCMDALLATNMISVGVDVNRLGLMVVTGQPKLSAEYIQATSRVGRRHPGLIVTLYNWTRPRDRSHYERFVSYHNAIYSQVEPTSVTPYSRRALDRGLHAVLISLVRHAMPEMNPEAAAELFDPSDPAVIQIMNQIRQRIDEVDPEEAGTAADQLGDIIRRWQTLAQWEGNLSYSRKNRNNTVLMEAAEDASLYDGLAFPTLNSLRGVEGEAGVSTYLMFQRKGN